MSRGLPLVVALGAMAALVLSSVHQVSGDDANAAAPRVAGDIGRESTSVPQAAVVNRDPKRTREPGEWQGMPIDSDGDAPPCDTSATCGLARACVSGRCVACAGDAECAAGETCVLQHCLLRTNARCRTARECGRGELCVVSDYSSDFRGNGVMRSACLGTGPNPFFEPVEPTPRTPASSAIVETEDVRSRLEELRDRRAVR